MLLGRSKKSAQKRASGECRHKNDVKYGNSNLCGLTNFSGNAGDDCVADWDCNSYMCNNITDPEGHPNAGKKRWQCAKKLKLATKCSDAKNCESGKMLAK